MYFDSSIDFVSIIFFYFLFDLLYDKSRGSSFWRAHSSSLVEQLIDKSRGSSLIEMGWSVFASLLLAALSFAADLLLFLAGFTATELPLVD